MVFWSSRPAIAVGLILVFSLLHLFCVLSSLFLSLFSDHQDRFTLLFLLPSSVLVFLPLSHSSLPLAASAFRVQSAVPGQLTACLSAVCVPECIRSVLRLLLQPPALYNFRYRSNRPGQSRSTRTTISRSASSSLRTEGRHHHAYPAATTYQPQRATTPLVTTQPWEPRGILSVLN